MLSVNAETLWNPRSHSTSYWIYISHIARIKHWPSAKTSSTVTTVRPTVNCLPIKQLASRWCVPLLLVSVRSFFSNLDRIFFIFARYCCCCCSIVRCIWDCLFVLYEGSKNHDHSTSDVQPVCWRKVRSFPISHNYTREQQGKKEVEVE